MVLLINQRFLLGEDEKFKDSFEGISFFSHFGKKSYIELVSKVNGLKKADTVKS